MRNNIIRFTFTALAISILGLIPQASRAEEYYSFSKITDVSPDTAVGMPIPIETTTIVSRPVVIEKEKKIEKPIIVEQGRPVVIKEKSHKDHHLFHLGIFPLGGVDLF